MNDIRFLDETTHH